MRKVRLAIEVLALLMLAFVAAIADAQIREPPKVDTKPSIQIQPQPNIQVQQQPNIQTQTPDIQIQQRPEIQQRQELQAQPQTPVHIALPPDPPKEVRAEGHCDYKQWQCARDFCVNFDRAIGGFRPCLLRQCAWVDRNCIDDIVEWFEKQKK